MTRRWKSHLELENKIYDAILDFNKENPQYKMIWKPQFAGGYLFYMKHQSHEPLQGVFYIEDYWLDTCYKHVMDAIKKYSQTNESKMKMIRYKLDNKGNPVHQAIQRMLGWMHKIVECPNENKLPFDCGTPGGFVFSMLSILMKEEVMSDIKIGENDWVIGADAFARILGFKHMCHIKRWAHENPFLWGNMKGYLLFCNNSAYGYKDTDKFTIKEIVNHWCGVLKRIENLKEK